MAVSPFLKPLGVAAAAIASFQAVAWGTLSLLGVLASEEVFHNVTTTTHYSDLPKSYLYGYVVEEKDTTLPFTCVYLASSVVWLAVSSWLLYDFLKNNIRFITPVIWATVTFSICVLDLVATIMFGLEFRRKLDKLDDSTTQTTNFAVALPPLVLMLLSARGFVLWFVNFAAAVYLSIAAHKLKTGTDTEEVKQNTAARRMSDSTSLYGSMAGERDTYSRANHAYQPEPLSAWNIQSPTVGDMKRGPWNFPESSSPARIFPRAPRPVSTPVAPVSPLPIPHPDYSPPLGRPVKHEPNMYEAPLRSALKKPTQFGRTIL